MGKRVKELQDYINKVKKDAIDELCRRLKCNQFIYCQLSVGVNKGCHNEGDWEDTIVMFGTFRSQLFIKRECCWASFEHDYPAEVYLKLLDYLDEHEKDIEYVNDSKEQWHVCGEKTTTLYKYLEYCLYDR